ncbi:RTA1 like protein-domain-containing protein [Dactylonectria estremocensis]|uniref:RTA1 like protein-domain-containing protein n=1 Tax=Dactylonectria estremocensis TaxID=1079267 RepID=A0A9P9E6V5_9HYPO|nr:RTA1 like protein-domain-containing protein [Dactylonectria estremocensis]
MSDTQQENQFYKYHPSTVVAAIVTALFGLSSAFHLFQLLRKRTWYFIPFFCGCLLEAIGYGARSINASKTPNWTLVVYIIETLFILLAPALLAASIYMVLGRIVQLLDAGHLSWVPPRWLTKLFVAGDVLSFVTQLAGGGILASADDKKMNDLGKYVILVGLAIQIVFFGFFFVVTIAFHQRIRQEPTPASTDPDVPWRSYIFVLYTVSTLILVRSVFRVIEYAMGKDGVLMSNEVFIYLFDALLIFICVAFFNIRHPSRIVSVFKQTKMSNDIPLEPVSRQNLLK